MLFLNRIKGRNNTGAVKSRAVKGDEMKKRAFLPCLLLAAFLTGCASQPASDGIPYAGETQEVVTAANSATDSRWEKIRNEKVLKIGIDETFAPVFYQENGTLAGFGVETAAEMCRRLGLDPQFVSIDWSQYEAALTDGTVDCLWGDICEEDGTVLEVSFAYLQGKQVLLCRTSSQTDNLAQLKEQSLGVRDGSCGDMVMELSTEFRSSLQGTVEYENYTELIRALDEGTITGAVVDDVVADYYIAQAPEDYYILTSADGETQEVLAREAYCVAFPLGEQTLSVKIEEALVGMRDDGTIAALSQKWFGEDLSVSE